MIRSGLFLVTSYADQVNAMALPRTVGQIVAEVGAARAEHFPISLHSHIFGMHH